MKTPFPKLRWGFLLNPGYAWFDDFASRFVSPDICFIADYEDDKPTVYSLASYHLSELEDTECVWNRALALKTILDGAIFLRAGLTYCPSKLGELYDFEADHHRGWAKDASDITASPFSSNYNDWLPQWKSNASPFALFESAMLWLAREDSTARGMLQFLGANGCSWITLYGLFDFMRAGAMSVNDIAAVTKSNPSEIKRFTHTANNFAAIGPLCRHGDLGHQPPDTPMRLEEAAKLLLPAARFFLIERVKALKLPEVWLAQNT